MGRLDLALVHGLAELAGAPVLALGFVKQGVSVVGWPRFISVPNSRPNIPSAAAFARSS
jgi:hypothetical protein